MKLIPILATLALAGCATPYTVLVPPSPAYCRDVGNVAVPDGAPVTGQIVEYHLTDGRGVWEGCKWQSGRGCAVKVDGGYAIYVRDDGTYPDDQVFRTRVEEECHALYEVAEHVSAD